MKEGFLINFHQLLYQNRSPGISHSSHRLLWCSAWRSELLYAAMRMVAGSHPRCHSVRITYRPRAALRLLRSLRISHNKFLLANKEILKSLNHISYSVWDLNLLPIFSTLQKQNKKTSTHDLPRQCFSNGSGNLGNLSSNKEMQPETNLLNLDYLLKLNLYYTTTRSPLMVHFVALYIMPHSNQTYNLVVNLFSPEY